MSAPPTRQRSRRDKERQAEKRAAADGHKEFEEKKKTGKDEMKRFHCRFFFDGGFFRQRGLSLQRSVGARVVVERHLRIVDTFVVVDLSLSKHRRR